MKNSMAILGLAFIALTASLPGLAGDEAGDLLQEEDQAEDVAVEEDPKGLWKCRAQPVRLIRVFTVQAEGYRSDIQKQAVDQCNAKSVFHCWPLGCIELQR